MAVETTTLVRYYEATVTDPDFVPSGPPEATRRYLIEMWDQLRELPEGGHEYLSEAEIELFRWSFKRSWVEVFAAESPHLRAATFVCFPWAPPSPTQGWWRDPDAVSELLGMLPQQSFAAWPDTTESFVARTLVDPELLFFERISAERLERPLAAGEHRAQKALNADLAAARNFVTQLLELPVVPVEESPLTGASLGELLDRAPGAAGALIAAWSTPDDQTLLLLITMPTGIVLFGAAASVAKALDQGLRAKILGWLGVPDPLRPPAAADDRSAPKENE